MGACFLFDSETPINKDAVCAVFRKKGFAEPAEHALGTATLWLYRKQLVDDDNFHFADPDTAIFATGTVVYRGKSYRESLVTLLDDFRRNRLDFDEMIGSFCLIFHVAGRVHVLTDRLNVQHVFVDDAGTRLSTSLLAVLASASKPWKLNRRALHEKLITGYLVGPDTYVDGIRQATDALQQASGGRRFAFVPHPPRPRQIELCREGFDRCVDHQIAVIRRYFERIGPLAAEYSPELGLSAGYDSRTLMAFAPSLPVPLSMHTHGTLGVHEAEVELVKQLVAAHGHRLTIEKTCPAHRMNDDQLAAMMSDCLYYFDGRNTNNMGSLSEVYTRSYKLKTLGESRLSLNGLGGEVYRNYYHTSRRRFDFRQWANHHLYYPFAAQAMPSRQCRDEVHASVVAKLATLLNIDFRGAIDQVALKRYYSEVQMPHCHCANNNAHNQVAFYLTPFIEHGVIREAYRALPYLGVDGAFQSAMIARLDKALAGIPSHYGHSFRKVSFSRLCYATVYGYLPDRFWNLRTWMRIKFLDLGRSNYVKHLAMVERNPSLRTIAEALRDFVPELDGQWCLRDWSHFANTFFVGAFLREFAGHLRV